MNNIVLNQPKNFKPDEQEVYLRLKRGLDWNEGFGILFVSCTTVQESLIIGKVKEDLKDKKVDVLTLEHSIDNLYDLIDEKVKDNPIDILFITGIEKSLALENYIKRTLENPKIYYQKESISSLLGHLNWQRERFRDNFNCCLVFTVRKYTLKYLVRRAPDFFDWKSGVIQFPTDRDIDLLQCYTPFQRYVEQDYLNQEQQKSFFEKKDINIQEYILLLEKLFLLEYESNGDLQFIYSVVKSNLDKLDNSFAQLLQNWILDTYSEINPEEKEVIAEIVENLCVDISQFPFGRWANVLEIAITGLETLSKLRSRETFPEQWATIQTNLGYVYTNRIFGSKAENLERAIAYYYNALEVYTRETFPEQWATTLNNLAIAYTQRIKGERGENLEQAISCYFKALEVRIYQYFPKDWATTQNNLGNAYIDRIYGEKGENLEKAIVYFYQSLKIYTKESFPQDWATTQNNLANAYRDRIRGDKAENLEKAIACYQNALQIHTREALPLQWAETLNNLGIAYSLRIKGDKGENIEMAITCYQNALEIRTREALPLQWAETLNNLGIAYSLRIKGDKGENIEEAIACYQNALKVRTQEALPLQWGETQTNLANAYRDRIRGDKADNIERAIACYKNALQIRTREALPLQWAETLNNLGIAYSLTIKGDKGENIEMAIACYQNALEIRTREALPLQWAATHNNLANAYRDRIRGDKAGNIEKAISCYHNALKIRTKEYDPLNCLQTARNLANLHYNEKQWQPATEAYHLAIEAVENARLEALNPQSRKETLSNAIDVFHRIVQAHLNLNQPDKALEYIERSKGRNLVELMTQKGLKPQGVSQETIDQLAELKQQVVNEQIRLQNHAINHNINPDDNLTPYIQDHIYLKEYQQELDSFIREKITPHDAIFSLTQKVEPINFREIQNLIDDQTAIIEWYITDNQILTFITTRHRHHPQVLQLDFAEEFVASINEYLNLYYTDKQQWQTELSSRFRDFAQILHLDEIISCIPPEQYKKIILIPHRFLHLLPIHAFDLNDGTCLLDHYPNGVAYSPSCKVLQLIQNQQRPNFQNLLAIQNPTGDLLYTDLEVQIISSYFPHADILSKRNATKTAFKNYHNFSLINCLHISSHSYFNIDSPLESAFRFANGQQLTLAEVFELNLNQCHLVTLSACETGLTDFRSLSDEYISFPSSFIYAGTSNVVSNLWTVDDLATAFLMIKFYQNLQVTNSVAIALQKAQRWLRDLTFEEFDQFLEHLKPKLEQVFSQMRQAQRLIFKESLKQIRQSKPHPFENPFYWAAFCAIGK